MSLENFISRLEICISRLEMYISRLEIYILRLEMKIIRGIDKFFYGIGKFLQAGKEKKEGCKKAGNRRARPGVPCNHVTNEKNYSTVTVIS